ncbi:MAG: MoaD/ThiS family protein [Planctomycetota bacterium]
MKLFAGVREALGRDSVPVRLEPGARVADLLAALAAEHPAIAARRGSLGVAVNLSLARAEDPLQPGDEVALIPPLGGG